jgi:hypothetical protein
MTGSTEMEFQIPTEQILVVTRMRNNCVTTRFGDTALLRVCVQNFALFFNTGFTMTDVNRLITRY